MAPTPHQSRMTLTSLTKSRGNPTLSGALRVLVLLLLIGVTILSVSHSVRFYITLTSRHIANGGGVGSGGFVATPETVGTRKRWQGSTVGKKSAALATAEVSVSLANTAGEKKKDKDRAAALPPGQGILSLAEKAGGREKKGSYALLYPSGECTGQPVTILHSSTEKNCKNCRDFCNAKFVDPDKTANLVAPKSVFVFGDHFVEVIDRCIGEYNYDQYQILKVIKPEEGCVRLQEQTSHARFAET